MHKVPSLEPSNEATSMSRKEFIHFNQFFFQKLQWQVITEKKKTTAVLM